MDERVREEMKQLIHGVILANHGQRLWIGHTGLNIADALLSRFIVIDKKRAREVEIKDPCDSCPLNETYCNSIQRDGDCRVKMVIIESK